MKNILTYIELKDSTPVKLSLETLSKASEIAKENSVESFALVLEKISDEEVNVLKAAGADKILIVARENYNMEEYSNVLTEIAKNYEVEDIFIPGTLDGKDIAANVAANLNTVSVTNVMDIKINEKEVEYITPAYGATVLNVSTIKKAPRVITTRSGAFNKRDDLNGKGEVVEENIEELKDLKAIIRDIVTSNEEEINLEDAPIIVTCGRGASSDEIFPLVKELADVFNAPISGTRPVIDDGVLPKSSQIGQSGKIVSPKLYIGCGLSGAVQHVSGIENSGFIVAINKDEDAPIFEMADIGIVGDCAKILPLFIEEIKKIRNN